MSQALFTDLYELNMVASYLRHQMTGPATFSLFVRDLPPGRGFLVAAGLEDCLSYLEDLTFAEEDLAWLARAGYPDDTVTAFGRLRFTGDVMAVPEGTVVLANEPLLEVTAPLPEAQLVETYLLNQMTYQTAVATKAVRCRLAAGPGIDLVDFSLRRTHGTEAGLAAARLSAMAGFVATSDVEAARRFGLTAAGTMAHSYVQAFGDEATAFEAFARDHPGQSTFLVDTYDTLAGVDAAIDVIERLGLPGPVGVRIDSGDLAELARAARRRLDAAGLERVRIFVSGSLDEYGLEALVDAGAPVDAAGVGTRLGVSADAPSLDSAYKLVAYDGRPILKLSTGKATLPGAKQVWRHRPFGGDVIATRSEAGPDGAEPLLRPAMGGGRRVGRPEPLDVSRRRVAAEVEALPAGLRRLRDPEPAVAVVSAALADLNRTTAAAARRPLPPHRAGT